MESAERDAYGPLALKPGEFNCMTPAEFRLMADGYEWRRKQAARDRVELAWLIEALHRHKRLPPLAKLLKSDGQADVRTPEERRREYEDLKQRLG